MVSVLVFTDLSHRNSLLNKSLVLNVFFTLCVGLFVVDFKGTKLLLFEPVEVITSMKPEVTFEVKI